MTGLTLCRFSKSKEEMSLELFGAGLQTLFGAGLQTPPCAGWLFGAGLQTPPTPFRGPGRTAGLPPGSGLETCPRQFQGLFFWFFAGMPAAYFRNTIGDHLDTIQLVRSAAAQAHFTFGDCVPLRADL